MAFWKAPWDGIFARPAATTTAAASAADEDFSVIDAESANSGFGVRSLPSHAFEPLYHKDNTHIRSCSAHSCPAADQLRKARLQKSVDFRLGFDDEQLNDIDSSTRRSANALKSARRWDKGHDYQDLRSAARSEHQERRRGKKYYQHRTLARGRLSEGALARRTQPVNPHGRSTLVPNHCTITAPNSLDLYIESYICRKAPPFAERTRRWERDPWEPVGDTREPEQVDDEDYTPAEIDEWWLSELDDGWLENQRQAYNDAQAETVRKQRQIDIPIKLDRRLLRQSQRAQQSWIVA